MAFLPYFVFLGLIVAANTCQLSPECDTTCENLRTYILENTVTDTKYRLQYHVSTPIGWMNDPNGFIYYKGLYHIFYQYNPYDSVPGNIHWGHATSPDLVTWTTQPPALIPEDEQCFSGSAIVYGSTLVLMYTAHITKDDITTESQYLAFSDDGINFLKYSGNPVLAYSPSSADFRDPKVWKHGDLYYVILGHKITDTETSRGSVQIYTSKDLLTWTFAKVIAEASATETQESSYMWECPDFFELNGKFVLLMSPQGMTAVDDRYKNLHQTGYILGSFSYTDNTFTVEQHFQELDYGHDFYATQTMEKDGKRYLSAWFGMWESTFPEAADGWAGALTMFRELTLSGTRILMNPVEAITELRKAVVYNDTVEAATGVITTVAQTGELIITADWTKAVSISLEGQTAQTGSLTSATLSWDPTSGKVAVNRGDDVRQMTWAAGTDLTWRLFLDTSSLELFCGKGDVVFSTRVYPLGGWKITNLSADQAIHVLAYSLKRSVPH